MSYTTGRRYEQELVRRFHAAGWGALRLGASGGGGDADLPDVFAGKPIQARRGQITQDIELFSNAIAVELKAGKASTMYIQQSEVAALEAFASQWGARAFLGARSTRQGTTTDTYLVPPTEARRTPEGNYGLPVAELAERAAVVVGDDGVEWL